MSNPEQKIDYTLNLMRKYEAESLKRELGVVYRISSDKCISLRLDIKGMSRIKKSHFPTKKEFNPIFADVMIEVMTTIAKQLNAQIAFTQSDEITLIIESGRDKNPEYCHPYGGRVQKLVSITAALASVEATNLLRKHYSNIPNILFDCRAGEWDTLEYAENIIRWRKMDCYRNGLSDAVYALPNGKQLVKLNTDEKIKILGDINVLPKHQIHGTILKKTYKEKECVNQKTGETTKCIRSTYEILD